MSIDIIPHGGSNMKTMIGRSLNQREMSTVKKIYCLTHATSDKV